MTNKKNDKTLGKHAHSKDTTAISAATATEQSQTPNKKLKITHNDTTTKVGEGVEVPTPRITSKVVSKSKPLIPQSPPLLGKATKTTSTSSMIIGSKPLSPPMITIPILETPPPTPSTHKTPKKTSNSNNTPTTPSSISKKELTRSKKEQLTPDEFNSLIDSLTYSNSHIESLIDSDYKNTLKTSPQLPLTPLITNTSTTSPITSPLLSPMTSPSLHSSNLMSKILNSKEDKKGEKKPRILKSDHLPKLSKGPKVSKKIEKLQNKYIKYHTPDQSLRGDWTVRDDYNLVEQIQLNNTPEQMQKDHQKYFTREFTKEEIEKRWRSLLQDVDTSDEGAGLMVLNPFTPKHPPLSIEEKSILSNSQINLDKSYFVQLLQEHRAIFHSSRTSKYLLSTFKHMIMTQDITTIPSYLTFLNNQKEKIKLLNNNNNGNNINGNDQLLSPTITTSNTSPPTTTTTTTTTTTNDSNNMIIDNNNNLDDINFIKSIENENYKELFKFLYNKDIDFTHSQSNVTQDSLNNKTKWGHVLTSNLPNPIEIQNDIILNPFSGIPQYLMSSKEEKNDMKSMVKIEREYELDKDRESRSLAVIRGRNIRYLMKSKDIIIGRNFSEKNIIDLDLLEEHPTHINLISKKQLIIKLKSDVNFYIQNIGKNNVFVNGCPIPQNEKIHLQDLSLIEFADIRIIFEMNKVFLAKVRRHIALLTAPKKTNQQPPIQTPTQTPNLQQVELLTTPTTQDQSNESQQSMST